VDEQEQAMPEDSFKTKEDSQHLAEVQRYVAGTYQDRYYNKIGADRRQELFDEVVAKRRAIADYDMQQYNIPKIKHDFLGKYEAFNSQYAEKELARQTTFEQMKQTHIMKDFLVDLSN
jgi:hypothetical protein